MPSRPLLLALACSMNVLAGCAARPVNLKLAAKPDVPEAPAP